MSSMENLSRSQIEKLVDGLTDLCLAFIDAQTAEATLRAYGFGDTELEAIGFDVEV